MRLLLVGGWHHFAFLLISVALLGFGASGTLLVLGRARTVKVLPLEDGRRRQSLTDFLQVWHEGRWLLFDPNTGLVSNTDDLLLWQTDTPSVLEVIGGTRSRVTFSMISQIRSTMGLATQQAADDFSLYSLPIAEQGMFKLILLLPVGALVVVIMRLLVGIRTSGTFMPILIALTFLQTELVPGIISLVLVVSVGLMLRSYLSALNLLLVARIATIVVIVIGIVSFFAVISYRLGLIAGQTITFFPMIILAWTIERMSILWEEEGPREVLIQGGSWVHRGQRRDRSGAGPEPDQRTPHRAHRHHRPPRGHPRQGGR